MPRSSSMGARSAPAACSMRCRSPLGPAPRGSRAGLRDVRYDGGDRGRRHAIAQARHAAEPRRGMRAVALAAIVVTATISPLAAQGSTAELLGQAHEFYERLEVERALPLLRQIVSPNWPF